MRKIEQELVTLKNNLDCIFIHVDDCVAASVQMWFRAGSALETGSDKGIAHFLEHMFFKGTKKRPGTALVEEVESFGGEINAFTSFDYTCYYINTPNTSLVNATDIILDMVSHPVFRNEDIAPERDVVFEEFRRSIDSPSQFAFYKVQDTCFSKGHDHSILGNKKTIVSFSKKQLMGFRKMFYSTQNAFLIVAGNIAKQKKKLTNTISLFQLPKGSLSSFPKFSLKKRPAISVHHKETAMASLYLCIESSGIMHPQAPCEDLAISCLGYGESSTLYKELVIKNQLANTLSSSTMFLNKGGVHFIQIAFPYDMLQKLLRKLEAILKTIAQDQFGQKEIRRIKNQYLASKIFRLESLESYAFSIGYSYAQTKNINYDDQFIERIRQTDAYSVNEAFVKIFNRPVHLSLQIPKGAPIEKTKKLLLSFQKNLTSSLKKEIVPNQKHRVQISKYDSNLKFVHIVSGVKLLYKHIGISPTFVLQAHLRGGKREETETTSGIYHLFSSMLTKGHRYATHEQLKSDIEEKSASLSSFSSKDLYGLSIHGLSRYFHPLSDHLFESLLFPSFNNTDFQTEKELILRNIKSNKENPQKVCFTEVSKLFFSDHPYSLDPLGTLKSVRSLKRKDLLQLHAREMNKKEILFTYCGDMGLAEVLSYLKKQFMQLSLRQSENLKPKKMKQIVTTSDIYFNREQTQIFTGIKIQKPTARENLYLKLLTTYLSGQSSPLFIEVRDRLGLCYSVAPIHRSFLEGGYWGIYMASGHDKTSQAITAIRKIVNNIKEQGLSKSYFEQVKTMIKGQNLINIQTPEDYANIYSHLFFQGHSFDYFYRKSELIDKCQYKDFVSSLSKILCRKWTTILVGRK